MAKKAISETITENIFRDHYGPLSFIEKSAIPSSYGFKSKKGSNYKGYPDFFRDEVDYAIVVEAKADDFDLARDEVKYYCLNNRIKSQKDIIGIAISGQTKNTICVQHYLFIRGKQMPIEFGPNDALYSLVELDKVYKQTKYGDAVSDEELTTILCNINKVLHRYNVRDTDRSLFFSGIMIALTNDNFRNSYKDVLEPSDTERAQTKLNLLSAHYLNKRILESVDIELHDRINSLSKEYSWIDRFAFIKTIDIPLSDYKALIKRIEYNIFIPFQANQKHDILGRAYRIFLSRAGKVDNKNIILTPDHIKNLMVKLARLNRNDVVLDTCTGSGGFLMEAMERMIALAENNEQTKEHIRTQQLIGFEIDTVLFALACSNMFLHGDGRTNMLYRSSLLNMDERGDKLLFDQIRSMKPTKVIINPPYENNLSIQFTKQALEYLEPNGKLIIIMPSPTLKQNVGGLTDEILKCAKLDFVIKLPVDIFREQNRTVYTSIFGFSKTPHDPNDEVLFYQLKSDGLVSVQHKGRVDKFNKWAGIEASIIDTVLNGKEIPTVSKKKKIYRDGVLNPYGFQEDDIMHFPMKPLSALFDMRKGTIASEDASPGEYRLVTAGDEMKTVDSYTNDGEAIVYAVSASGSLGKAHFVDGKFSASNLCVILMEKDHDKYPVNMRFYECYLNSIRESVIFDIADGTSKLTIGDDDLKQYRIQYVPIDIQDSFEQQFIAPIIELEKKLNEAKKNLSKSINETV